MPKLWTAPQAAPSYEEPSDTPVSEDDDTEVEQPQPAPPADVMLHVGADTHVRPDWVPPSLVDKWNSWNDYGVYQLALAGDAAGLTREEADRRAQAGAATMATGALATAAVGSVVGSSIGCIGGGAIGALAGGVAAGIPTVGVGAPVGVAGGFIAGCMIGATVLAVPLMVGGAFAGGAVGGVLGSAFAGGDSAEPAPAPAELAPPAPAAEVAEIDDSVVVDDSVVAEEVAQPLPAPTNPVDDLVASVAGAAHAFWAQFGAPVPPQTFQAAQA